MRFCLILFVAHFVVLACLMIKQYASVHDIPATAHLQEDIQIANVAERFVDKLIALDWSQPSFRQQLRRNVSDVCIVIISGKPRQQRYVVRSAVSILHELTAMPRSFAERFALHVIEPPSNAATYEYVKLRQLVKTYRVDETRIEPCTNDSLRAQEALRTANEIEKISKQRQFLALASENYVLALNICQQTNSRYSVIVEDDAVAGKGSLIEIFNALIRLETLGDDWSHIKLWYTDAWSGWEVEDMPIFLTVALLSACVCLLVGRYRYHLTSTARLFWLALYGASVAPCLLMCIDKRILTRPFPRGLTQTSIDCCSPAHVYNNLHTRRLADYIWTQTSRCREIDLLIEDFRKFEGLKQYQLVPHPFQHIGRWSSFKKSDGTVLLRSPVALDEREFA